MLFLTAFLNLCALGALFANHRLAATVCFMAYTAVNLLLLFQQSPTGLDPAFFAIQALSVLVVFVALSSQTRDQVLTHQKKRGSIYLLVWVIVLAVFFGHWLLSLHQSPVAPVSAAVISSDLPQGETFMLVAVVILWLVGKNLYDRR